MSPVHANLGSLRRNLVDNGRLGVRVRTEALAGAGGTATLKVTDSSHAGQNTLGAPVYPSTRVIDEIEVRVTTFDRLVEEEGLERLDVVKIDVEGAEQLVLEGAEASLRRFRPLVMLELQDPSLRRLGSSAAKVVSLLETLDYRVVEYSETTGKPLLADARVVVDNPKASSPNVVACPIERLNKLE